MWIISLGNTDLMAAAAAAVVNVLGADSGLMENTMHNSNAEF